MQSASKVSAIDLLSIKVTSSKSIAVAKFNKKVDIAARQDAQWVKDPISVIRKYNYWPGRTAVIFIDGDGEHPSTYKITIIYDGFSGDSVRGQHDEITIVQNQLDIWHLKSIKTSWRCWSGRGHTDYSIEPCA
ncbi:hypothetical protein MNBD_GAMMA12-1525 [hydrothermal vent metagenome]|uniref:Uncharacterized protein n=1 Tax=hydrothermal vent metagenome TaxID=652676 RepID=A0A3B0Z4Z3_9ZZZZ